MSLLGLLLLVAGILLVFRLITAIRDEVILSRRLRRGATPRATQLAKKYMVDMNDPDLQSLALLPEEVSEAFYILVRKLEAEAEAEAKATAKAEAKAKNKGRNMGRWWF